MKIGDFNFLKTSKIAVSLLSTGLDSPIATYLIMRQGFNCVALSFLNGNDKSVINKNKIIAIGKKIVQLTGARMRLHFVDYDKILEKFKSNAEAKFTCIFCKRTMLMAAERLSNLYSADIIINGDILGEQASQTIDNLMVVNQIVKKTPVIRPLIGFDKLDIIKISQKTGLYQMSLMEGVAREFNPIHPETRGKLDEILKAEENIDREAIIDQIFQGMEFIDL